MKQAEPKRKAAVILQFRGRDLDEAFCDSLLGSLHIDKVQVRRNEQSGISLAYVHHSVRQRVNTWIRNVVKYNQQNPTDQIKLVGEEHEQIRIADDGSGLDIRRSPAYASIVEGDGPTYQWSKNSCLERPLEDERARKRKAARVTREAESAKRRQGGNQSEAEERRKAKEQREAEERRKAEEQLEADERRKAEEQREAEERRKAEEQREAEKGRKAEEQREAEEKREAEKQHTDMRQDQRVRELREQEEQKQREQLADEEHMKALEKPLSLLGREAKVYGTYCPVLFLSYLYRTHPPLKEPPEVKVSGARRNFLTAMIMYHPDKNNASPRGRQWYVFCSETTKILNTVLEEYDEYQRLKSI